MARRAKKSYKEYKAYQMGKRQAKIEDAVFNAVPSKSVFTQRKPSVTQVKTIVNRAIHKSVENKVADYYVNGLRQYNITNDSASFATNNYFWLSPCASGNRGCIIPQGTGQQGRTGNQIRIMKSTVRMALYPYSGNYATSQGENVDINVYIIKPKNARTLTEIQSIVTTAFWQNGNSDLPLTGDLLDNILTPNKDIYMMKKRLKFKLGPSAPGAVAVNAFYSNDYKYNIVKTIDVTKYLNKRYKFNDTDDQPYETPTLMIFSPAPPQNQLEGSTHQTFFMSYMQQTEYEDA